MAWEMQSVNSEPIEEAHPTSILDLSFFRGVWWALRSVSRTATAALVKLHPVRIISNPSCNIRGGSPFSQCSAGRLICEVFPFRRRELPSRHFVVGRIVIILPSYWLVPEWVTLSCCKYMEGLRNWKNEPCIWPEAKEISTGNLIFFLLKKARLVKLF